MEGDKKPSHVSVPLKDTQFSGKKVYEKQERGKSMKYTHRKRQDKEKVSSRGRDRRNAVQKVEGQQTE